MLRPNKYTDIGLSVVGISAEVLRLLRADPAQKYTQLLGKVTHRLGDEAKTNFLLALTFLYSLGQIEYHKDEDVVELVA